MKKESRAKSNAERQQIRREKLKKEGKRKTIYLNSNTLEHLNEIVKRTANSRNQRNDTEKNSSAIDELINQYYLDHILEYEHESSENLVETYGQIWDKIFEGESNGDIARKFNEEDIPLPLFSDGKTGIHFKAIAWTEKYVIKCSTASIIIKAVKDNESKND
ncbi:hypothetical protein HS962_04895 [Pantoea sp. BIGb0393]|uniref:Uncharacterized protein n=1 Tax=Pantoea nemavictus TaxID=2726955 RepID=A0ABU8PRG9_9GAMM|nr:hypothetical protein [Pantoea nemavictus]MBA0035569.1 hypothetical protein [Pantoea nemavictus]